MLAKLATNRWAHFILLLLFLLGAVYYSGSDHDLRHRLQNATFDKFNQIHPRPATDRVIIVDLDEESLRRQGQWPWPRDVMARLVERLRAMGAKVVAFDMVFAEPDRTSPQYIAARIPDIADYAFMKEQLAHMPEHDKVFAEAIARAGNVVTGFTQAKAEDTLRAPVIRYPPVILGRGEGFLEDSYPASGVVENLYAFSAAAAGNGSFMATPDIDGIIRRVALFVTFPQPGTKNAQRYQPALYPGLSLDALRVSVAPDARYVVAPRKGGDPWDTGHVLRIGKDYSIPVESDTRMWVYYRDLDREKEYISAFKVLDPEYEGEVAPRLKDKIVLVGTSAEGLRDIRSTPLSIFIPGVEVHVNVVEQIMQGKYLLRPQLVVGIEACAIFLVGLLLIVLASFVGVFVLALLCAASIGGGFYVSWHAYTALGLLLDPVYPGIVLSTIFLLSTLLSYIRSEAEKRQVRQAFGLYISPDFMAELTKDPDKLKLGGEVKELTVMFTDIRSFTAIAESMPPEALIQLMNDFLTPMSNLVMSNRGTIDKYMGDAMMAFWNAPLDDDEHARHACLAALKMNGELQPINEHLKAAAAAQGREPVRLRAGIGINTGPASVGNMGSRQRFAYSALGDTVNLASRLESQTKNYGVEILIGEATQAKVSDFAVLELDLLRVKGKTKPVHVYTLMGDPDFAATDEFRAWKVAHDRMIASYRATQFDEALKAISACRARAGGRLGPYYDLYAERIAELMKNRPAEGWDGVFTATSK